MRIEGRKEEKCEGTRSGRLKHKVNQTNYYERMTIMSKQMKTLLALIIVSMLTVLCACNSVAPPDRQNTPAEALSDNGNGDGLSSDFTDDSTGADVSETTSEESETTSGEESDQSEPEGDRSEEEQSETENSQSGTSEQSESSSDEEVSEANTVDGDTAPVSELVLFVPAGDEDNNVLIRHPFEGEGVSPPNMPRNLFVDIDGTISLYDCGKKRIAAFRNNELIDVINFSDYLYSYFPDSTASLYDYYAVAGDSEYIYLVADCGFRDSKTAMKICVINRSDKTSTFYDIMPENEKDYRYIQSFHSLKLNGKTLLDVSEGGPTVHISKLAFLSGGGLSVVNSESLVRYSSGEGEQTRITFADSSSVDLSTAGLPAYRTDGIANGSIIAGTDRYLYYSTWTTEDQFTSYVYKVEKSSGKIIEYVKHSKPDCMEWAYNYYVTDGDELYYMESVLSYDAEKCGTSVYKETFGNDFESIKIRGSADASASSAAQTVSGSSVISNKRSDVADLASQMCSLQWILRSQNKSVSPNINPATNSKLIPDYIYNKPVGSTITGIPYAHGGFNGLTTQSMNSFLSCVNAGYITGNISGAYYVPNSETGVVFCSGLDCSGFVSKAYGINKTQSWDLVSFGYNPFLGR